MSFVFDLSPNALAAFAPPRPPSNAFGPKTTEPRLMPPNFVVKPVNRMRPASAGSTVPSHTKPTAHTVRPKTAPTVHPASPDATTPHKKRSRKKKKPDAAAPAAPAVVPDATKTRKKRSRKKKTHPEAAAHKPAAPGLAPTTTREPRRRKSLFEIDPARAVLVNPEPAKTSGHVKKAESVKTSGHVKKAGPMKKTEHVKKAESVKTPGPMKKAESAKTPGPMKKAESAKTPGPMKKAESAKTPGPMKKPGGIMKKQGLDVVLALCSRISAWCVPVDGFLLRRPGDTAEKAREAITEMCQATFEAYDTRKTEDEIKGYLKEYMELSKGIRNHFDKIIPADKNGTLSAESRRALRRYVDLLWAKTDAVVHLEQGVPFADEDLRAWEGPAAGVVRSETGRNGHAIKMLCQAITENFPGGCTLSRRDGAVMQRMLPYLRKLGDDTSGETAVTYWKLYNVFCLAAKTTDAVEFVRSRDQLLRIAKKVGAQIKTLREWKQVPPGVAGRAYLEGRAGDLDASGKKAGRGGPEGDGGDSYARWVS